MQDEEQQGTEEESERLEMEDSEARKKTEQDPADVPAGEGGSHDVPATGGQGDPSTGDAGTTTAPSEGTDNPGTGGGASQGGGTGNP
jgi:hypothetical protein